MTKIEFLLKLEKQLAGLPEADRMRTIDYYNEIIDDRAEELGSEMDAVAAMDTPENIAAQVLADFSLSKLVKEKIKPRRMTAWKIVLLCLGFPIWFSLLVAAFAVTVGICTVAFSVTVALFASAMACGGAALAGVVSIVCFFVEGNWITGLFYLGLVLVCFGLMIYLWRLGSLLCKGVAYLTQNCILGIKRRMMKKEA